MNIKANFIFFITFIDLTYYRKSLIFYIYIVKSRMMGDNKKKKSCFLGAFCFKIAFLSSFRNFVYFLNFI